MLYEHLTLDAERSLYGLHGAQIRDCLFAGPADGESALKECEDVRLERCRFELRYPLWHVRGGSLDGCAMTDTCRAALWYDQDLRLTDCALGGIKALRECDRIALERCAVESTEFGWFCRGIRMLDCAVTGEYLFLNSRDLDVSGLRLKGKYSFQYVENAVLSHCALDTKDAFWHTKNVTVTDSEVRGEYLGWYSQNLRLVRCKISGTQPLCYANGLVLEDCEMEGADLAFENSHVQATLRGEVVSVKNPLSGFIEADRIGEIILDEHLPKDADCRITRRS